MIQSIRQSISSRLCGEAHRENEQLRARAGALQAKVKRQEADLVALNKLLRSDPPQPVMNVPKPTSNIAI